MLKELIDRVSKTGGATYNYPNGYYPTHGYVVSTHKECEEKTTVLDDRVLIDYISKNYHRLNTEGIFLGIWSSDGYHYLDIVTVTTKYLRAVRLARENKQKAIYDLDTGNTIKMEETLPEFEFDELLEGTQDQCIQDYLQSPIAMECAIDDLRHMKFNVNGKIVRGYDE